jgi:hypothetical protein
VWWRATFISNYNGRVLNTTLRHTNYFARLQSENVATTKITKFTPMHLTLH